MSAQSNKEVNLIKVSLLSLLIGVVAAACGWVLLKLIGWFTDLFFRHSTVYQAKSSEDFSTAGERVGLVDVLSGEVMFSLTSLLIFAGAGLCVGLMTHYLMPNGKNKGLSHVIEDFHVKGSVNHREGVVVGLISAVSIGAGASVGRWGPAVHVGSAAASAMAHWFHLNEAEKRMTCCAGISAAIAVSFSAPLAGFIFVQEVILRDWRLRYFVPLMCSGVVGAVIADYFGLHFYIAPGAEVHAYHHEVIDILLFAVVGVLCAFVGISFNRTMTKVVGWSQKIRIHTLLKPVIGGIILGLIGMQFPYVLGGGSLEINAAILGQLGIGLLLTFILLKFVLTIFSFASGFNGGVFGPGLFLGAMIGSLVAVGAEQMGFSVKDFNLFALAGMAAFVAVVVGMRVSAILIVLEVTNELFSTMAVLTALTVAFIVVWWVSGESLLIRQLNGRNANPFPPEEHERRPDTT